MHAPRPDQPADESADRTSDAVSGSSFTRRAFTGGVVAAAGLSLIGGWPSAAKADARLANGSNRNGDTRAFGSVAGSPHLSRDFTRTFQSHLIQANGIRQHAVIGGDGPPLLLVHGWPENWYAWRSLMPALARDFTVIAVDQRGIGLSDKPRDGYDTATLANDLVGADGRRWATTGSPSSATTPATRSPTRWPPTTVTASIGSRSPRSPGPPASIHCTSPSCSCRSSTTTGSGTSRSTASTTSSSSRW